MRQITKVTAIECNTAPMIPGATKLSYAVDQHTEIELLQFGVWLKIKDPNSKKDHERVIPFANLKHLNVVSEPETIKAKKVKGDG